MSPEKQAPAPLPAAEGAKREAAKPAPKATGEITFEEAKIQAGKKSPEEIQGAKDKAANRQRQLSDASRFGMISLLDPAGRTAKPKPKPPTQR